MRDGDRGDSTERPDCVDGRLVEKTDRFPEHIANWRADQVSLLADGDRRDDEQRCRRDLRLDKRRDYREEHAGGGDAVAEIVTAFFELVG